MDQVYPKAIWISWYPHRRTDGLCSAWGIQKFILASSWAGLRKWIDLARQTLGILRVHKPDVLVVQNPSLGLTILGVISRSYFKYHLVVDAHNEGIQPFSRNGRLIGWLTGALLRSADWTIVTNSRLGGHVRAAGGRPLILSDPLPVPPQVGSLSTRISSGESRVMVISTFAPDEPLDEIVSAARNLSEVRFSITGNAERAGWMHRELPPNVQLTGFVPDETYWQMIAESDLVCDLTTMPDCLVCGAYEALALEKPMVLSDNPPSRELFGNCAVFALPLASSIQSAVRGALKRLPELRALTASTRVQYASTWVLQSEEVKREIMGLEGPATHKSSRFVEL